MTEECATLELEEYRVSVIPNSDTHKMRSFQIGHADRVIVCRAVVSYAIGPGNEAEAIQYITAAQCMQMANALRAMAIRAFEEENDIVIG
jgi:hypothetical protein